MASETDGAQWRQEETEELDRVWSPLSNLIRRRIPDLLREGPRVRELCRLAVMKHLGVLQEVELVVPRRKGRKRFNSLRIGEFHPAIP